jgi:methionyl-tRNA formyltransferase
LKTLFFGTSDFAVPSLRVTAQRTQCAAAVTQPDRPAGRGHKMRPTPVKIAAIELGLQVYEPASLRAFADEIAGESFDLFVLASYGRILPASLLRVPRLGALNVHPSLLPKYRGATPIQSAILNGDSETGVSIMLMDAGMDTGDIVLQQTVPIGDGETYGELHDRLADIGSALLGDAFDLAQRGPLERHAQQGQPTITRPLRREGLLVDLGWEPQRIVRAVRAFSPAPGARAEFAGESVKLLRAHVNSEGGLVIDELIAPNRGPMSGEAYLRSRS